MVAHHATVDAADFWHVALAPGETKVLTLEQLDDLFRLDIIDAATRVWQPGMSDWLPLSVVAGLEAEPAKPKAAPPPPPSRAPARPPSPPQRPVAAASISAAPPARPVSFQPTPSAAPLAAPWPGNATPVAAPWPGNATPAPSVRPTPESFRPMVVSHRPAPVATGGGAGGRFVLALAFIAGVGVTLYRNDILRQAAVSAGQERAYMKVEGALGGPGFGTPRAVQVAGPVSLNAAAEAALTQPSSPSALEPQSPAATPPAKEPSATAELAKTPTDSAGAPNPVSLSSLVAARLPAAKAKAKAKAERPSPRPAARPASAGAQSTRELGIKGSSNGYDPLNGKL